MSHVSRCRPAGRSALCEPRDDDALPGSHRRWRRTGWLRRISTPSLGELVQQQPGESAAVGRAHRQHPRGPNGRTTTWPEVTAPARSPGLRWPPPTRGYPGAGRPAWERRACRRYAADRPRSTTGGRPPSGSCRTKDGRWRLGRASGPARHAPTSPRLVRLVRSRCRRESWRPNPSRAVRAAPAIFDGLTGVNLGGDGAGEFQRAAGAGVQPELQRGVQRKPLRTRF